MVAPLPCQDCLVPSSRPDITKCSRPLQDRLYQSMPGRQHTTFWGPQSSFHWISLYVVEALARCMMRRWTQYPKHMLTPSYPYRDWWVGLTPLSTLLITIFGVLQTVGVQYIAPVMGMHWLHKSMRIPTSSHTMGPRGVSQVAAGCTAMFCKKPTLASYACC